MYVLFALILIVFAVLIFNWKKYTARDNEFRETFNGVFNLIIASVGAILVVLTYNQQVESNISHDIEIQNQLHRDEAQNFYEFNVLRIIDIKKSFHNIGLTIDNRQYKSFGAILMYEKELEKYKSNKSSLENFSELGSLEFEYMELLLDIKYLLSYFKNNVSKYPDEVYELTLQLEELLYVSLYNPIIKRYIKAGGSGKISVGFLDQMKVKIDDIKNYYKVQLIVINN